MTHMTPPVLGGPLEDRQTHLALLVRRYIDEIEMIVSRLSNGDFGELAQLPKLRRELVSCAKQLRDTEIELDHQSKTNGTAAEDIDFDVIRDQIGRRLDRLRTAQGAGSISGGDE